MCNLIKVPWKFKDGDLISPSTSLVRWNINDAMQLIYNNSNFDTMILHGGILIDHYNMLVKICKFYLCYKDKSGHILYI